MASSAHPVEGQYKLIIDAVRIEANTRVQTGAINTPDELRRFVEMECRARLRTMLEGMGVKRTKIRRFCNALIVDAPSLSQCDVALGPYVRVESPIERSGVVG